MTKYLPESHAFHHQSLRAQNSSAIPRDSIPLHEQDFNIWTALVTPFDAGGKIYLPALRNLAVSLREQGAAGFVVAGTTGEFWSLHHDEWCLIVETIASYHPTCACIVMDDIHVLDKIAHAVSCGVERLLVLPPLYIQVRQDALTQLLLHILSHTKLPVWLYHNPRRSGTGFDFSFIDNLQKRCTIHGLKESDLRFSQWSLWLQQNPDFQLMCGEDRWVRVFRDLGAAGCISAASNVALPLLRQILHRHDPQREAQWLDLMSSLYSCPNPLFIKESLNLQGWRVGAPRSTLAMPTNHELMNLKHNLSLL